MIEFILNDKMVKTSVNSGVTLLDFIRNDKNLTGTKIGCREGDCGACTVLMGELQNDKSVKYKSITSCISPLGNAQGKHIVTIEGVNLKDKLNVAQNSIKENFATQCGFCTPGFIMSLTGFAISEEKPTTEKAIDAISGNICRCTGYKSIEKASVEITEKLKDKDISHQIKWLVDNNFIPNYFETIPQKLESLNSTDIEQKGTIVSGGTDLYVRFADKLADENIRLISKDKNLKGINFKNNICIIGAGTTITELYENTELEKFFPKLKTFLKLISSQQIRNMGTIAGNFVNASPIGDMSIFFLALNSNLTIQNTEGKKRVIAFNNFFIDYKKFDLQIGEIITNVFFDLPIKKDISFNFEKISKRTHLDIASVNTAIQLQVKGNAFENVNISIGGVGAIPTFLAKTSLFLNGRKFSSETIIEAETILQSEISPISDIRGTVEYKRLLARQLFFAHFIEMFPDKFTLADFV